MNKVQENFFEIHLYEAGIQCRLLICELCIKVWCSIKLLSAAFKKKGDTESVGKKKKIKHDFGFLALGSREQKVTLGLLCRSEGWFIAAVLIRGQPHTLTGWGLARPLTVHGDLHSPYHWCRHIIGSTALVVP